ncbi:MAG TPA: hypothetical protein VFX39_01995, partial [Gemmatimonadaceae bacterium]|nr:hypothetical protein [Gemmatimonadaceae bacterium]
MLALLAAALLQGAAPATPAQPDTIRRDSAAAHAAAAPDSTRPRRRSRRVAVTPELLRTAFDDAGARELFERARAARLRQDTSLTAYDATTFQRISAGLGIRRFGRERLLFRQEEATRVRWVRGQGAVVDVLGKRQAVPSGEGKLQLEVDVGGDVGPIPYFPGQETLWLGSGDVAKAGVDDHGPVNPLADGAEAYYRYRSGDSVMVRLQTGRTITLRELQVRPRQPRWDLAVGSLWFDVSNAQLVRGVYRLSVPIEIWQVVEESGEDDVPGWVKTMVNPLRATVSAVTVEYGLEGGGFWLPRMQAMEAEAEAAFMRIPVRFEQTYRYASVNGTLDSLPAIPAAPDRAARLAADSAWRDTLRALPASQRDSARAARRERMNPCADDSVRTYAGSRFDGALRTVVRVPCDTTRLMHSPALPPSIFAEGEELFDTRLQEALVDAALSLGAQSDWAPQRPVVKWGLGDGLLRYNRVEGLSPAIAVEQQLGRGYSARAVARIGTADLAPNAEMGLARTDGRRTLGLAVYRRLAAANDWGAPLGLSSSL